MNTIRRSWNCMGLYGIGSVERDHACFLRLVTYTVEPRVLRKSVAMGGVVQLPTCTSISRSNDTQANEGASSLRESPRTTAYRTCLFAYCTSLTAFFETVMNDMQVEHTATCHGLGISADSGREQLTSALLRTKDCACL